MSSTSGEGDHRQGSHRHPKRCKISTEQLDTLIKSFEDEPLPDFDQRQTLAKVLDMTPRSVQIWFQNRRQRLKPLSAKADDASPSAHQSGQTPQQQLGMPGLAAVASLCNTYAATESLMMSKGMPPTSNGLAGFVNGTSYDVMEPFAATKALLGTGYQAPSLASLLSQQPHGSAACGCSPSMTALRRGAAGFGPSPDFD
jgi:hypothetical protein